MLDVKYMVILKRNDGKHLTETGTIQSMLYITVSFNACNDTTRQVFPFSSFYR